MATNDPKTPSKTDEALGVKTSEADSPKPTKIEDAVDDLARILGLITSLSPEDRAQLDNRMTALRAAVDAER